MSNNFNDKNRFSNLSGDIVINKVKEINTDASGIKNTEKLEKKNTFKNENNIQLQTNEKHSENKNSNISTNNRFNFIEELIEMKNNNSEFKNSNNFNEIRTTYDKKDGNSFTRLSYRDMIEQEKLQRLTVVIREKERVQKELQDGLKNVNFFPELTPKVDKVTVDCLTEQVPIIEEMSFIDKIKYTEEKKPVLIKDDLVLLGNEQTPAPAPAPAPTPAPAPVPVPKRTPKQFNKQIPKNTALSKTGLLTVINITERYNNWKQQYIDDYGYEDYVDKYNFPNYDYHYYDKLDEQWELDRQKYEAEHMEQEQDESYVSNFDGYNYGNTNNQYYHE
jgi:hypothetical protein